MERDGVKPFLWTKHWTNIFKSVPKTCGENRLREFHFKFIHRIVVTEKELFRFNIKSDSNCIYCGDLDSIGHAFSECQFTKSFTQEVLQWFNIENNSEFNPNTEDLLFGIFLSFSTLLNNRPRGLNADAFL